MKINNKKYGPIRRCPFLIGMLTVFHSSIIDLYLNSFRMKNATLNTKKYSITHHSVEILSHKSSIFEWICLSLKQTRHVMWCQTELIKEFTFHTVIVLSQSHFVIGELNMCVSNEHSLNNSIHSQCFHSSWSSKLYVRWQCVSRALNVLYEMWYTKET